MHQLLDRITCRLFHKRSHIVLEKGCTVPGWCFIYCNICKVSWPQRAMRET